MKSLNVRLTAVDSAAVRRLKADGENVSAIVRETPRERAAKSRKKPRLTKAAVTALVAKIDAMQDGEPVPEYIRLGINPAIRQQASAYTRMRLAARMGSPFR